MSSGSHEPEAAADSSATAPPRTLSSSLRVISVQRDSPVAFSPDGNRLAFAGSNHSILVLERRSDGLFTEYATLNGMSDTVTVLSFHPFIASNSADRARSRLYAAGIEGVFLWDVVEGRVQPTMKMLNWVGQGHEGQVECLCWVAGDSTLISGSKDSSFKIWDAANKFALLESNDDHKSSVLAVVSHEGAHLVATTGRDSQIKVWDAMSLQPSYRSRRREDSSIRLNLRFNFEGHRGDVTAIVFAQSGAALFSGARDNSVKIWDLVNGSLMRTIAGHKADVNLVAPINQDKLLVTGSFDGQVNVWELEDISAKKAAAESDIEAILAAQAQVLTEGDEAKPTDKLVHSFTAHESGVRRGALNAAYPLLVSTGRNNEVRLWNITDLLEPKLDQEVVGHSGSVNAVQLCHNDAWVATASLDCHVYLFEAQNGNLIGKVDCGAGMYALAVSADGATLFAGGNDFTIKAIPVHEGAPNRFQLAGNFAGHAGKINWVSTSPDGRFLASASADFHVRIWPARQQGGYGGSPDSQDQVRDILKFQPHKGVTTMVAWAPDNQGLFATCSNDHDIATWRFNGSGKPHRDWYVPSAHGKMVSSLAFGRGPSASFLFSGSWDYTVKVWNFTQGSRTALKTLVGHAARISAVSVSANGRVLTSGSGDGTLRVWDAVSPYDCQCECAEEGNRRIVTAVAAGTNVFVTGSEDGCVRLWPIADAMPMPHDA